MKLQNKIKIAQQVLRDGCKRENLKFQKHGGSSWGKNCLKKWFYKWFGFLLFLRIKVLLLSHPLHRRKNISGRNKLRTSSRSRSFLRPETRPSSRFLHDFLREITTVESIDNFSSFSAQLCFLLYT